MRLCEWTLKFVWRQEMAPKYEISPSDSVEDLLTFWDLAVWSITCQAPSRSEMSEVSGKGGKDQSEPHKHFPHNAAQIGTMLFLTVWGNIQRRFLRWRSLCSWRTYLRVKECASREFSHSVTDCYKGREAFTTSGMANSMWFARVCQKSKPWTSMNKRFNWIRYLEMMFCS